MFTRKWELKWALMQGDDPKDQTYTPSAEVSNNGN